MRKVTLTAVPLILALITIILIKPSDEKCRTVAIERLGTINIQASANDILITDYVLVKTLRYVHNTDTFKLGSGAFFQVKVNDRKLENIRQNIKP